MRATRKLPQGWMKKAERHWLAQQGAKVNSLAVEVGCFRGRSTLALVSFFGTGKLYAVDTWVGPPDGLGQAYIYVDAGDVHAEFVRNLTPEIRAGVVVPLRMNSLQGAAEIARRHGTGCLDFAFIDADHRYPAVHADILAYLPLMRPGGILAGHDYSERFPGVQQAVDELLPGAVKGPGSIWSMGR